ncbi:intradiol ring-cleavage dioxygenase [Nitrosovibrio sp. Nv4]|uniref:intradiol ring-cleavage dioxygenase n=1 Tax=Nitrosovibrio sp. Nv4 TaxID=1945880 RepID=UPI000BD69AD1|nr:intradiol ring-cleavage dioxygenase [Nitrosovibrio sp. Nv4]SOD42480.1 Dioxygenase [Nitrosovibrio sp. Nv4]
MNAEDCQKWLMSRRKMLALLSVTGINMLSGSSFGNSAGRETVQRALSCVVTPQQTEGPYFVDERLHRSDVRTDPSDGSIKEGLPLALEIRVFAVGGDRGADCKPIAGAVVDIWHCDAQGIYSDVMDDHFNTVGKKFLRGYQVTDKNGSVRFITIYPGWYPGRTVHIHFKIRTDPKYMQAHEFTSQLYFNDSITDSVYAQQQAYARREAYLTRARNEDDSIFRQGGDQLMLKLVETGEGYAATFDVGLELA